jgi:hypothetical protein
MNATVMTDSTGTQCSNKQLVGESY